MEKYKTFLENKIGEVKRMIEKSKMGCKKRLLGSMRCGSIVNQNGRITKNIYRCMYCKEIIDYLEVELMTLEYCIEEIKNDK